MLFPGVQWAFGNFWCDGVKVGEGNFRLFVLWGRNSDRSLSLKEESSFIRRECSRHKHWLCLLPHSLFVSFHPLPFPSPSLCLLWTQCSHKVLLLLDIPILRVSGSGQPTPNSELYKFQKPQALVWGFMTHIPPSPQLYGLWYRLCLDDSVWLIGWSEITYHVHNTPMKHRFQTQFVSCLLACFLSQSCCITQAGLRSAILLFPAQRTGITGRCHYI